ncbi:MAG: RNA polymerase sigma factor [Cytophagaceae bacterium]|nr:RNA polymerase sigma factor [Gemmatimonadaceae bacterium]
MRDRIDAIYRSESRRVLATLIRLLRDFDLAEEALHDAFVAAFERWPAEGIPESPRAWLVSAGRFRAIDHLRRRATWNAKLAEVARELDRPELPADVDDEAVEDDRLRLIFTCCHPALAPDAQVALTLRTVCGLTTEEIAHAYLLPVPTLAQRIVRAKNKIRDARIPYTVPVRAELPERLNAVLHVIYLVFNEAYAATFGTELTRSDLSKEAIRLGRLLLELLDDAEVRGLLALMLLHDARRASRTGPGGDVVLLADQDRSLWDREQIAEGLGHVQRALGQGRIGSFVLQATIAAVHAEARSAEETDWEQIVALYNILIRMTPTPVVDLNRGVARAMASGPEVGLAHIDAILAQGVLQDYQLAHSARAELLRRLGRIDDARAAYERALALTTAEPGRRFIQGRLDNL